MRQAGVNMNGQDETSRSDRPQFATDAFYPACYYQQARTWQPLRVEQRVVP